MFSSFKFNCICQSNAFELVTCWISLQNFKSEIVSCYLCYQHVNAIINSLMVVRDFPIQFVSMMTNQTSIVLSIRYRSIRSMIIPFRFTSNFFEESLKVS